MNPPKSTSDDWVKEQLKELKEKKSDRAVIKSEIKRVEGRIKALEDKPMDHACVREGDLRELRSELTSNTRRIENNTEEIKKVYKWYVRGLAALILFLITSGVGFVWYLAGMAFHLEAQGKALEKIELRLSRTPTPSEQIHSMEKTMREVWGAAAEKIADEAAERAVVRAKDAPTKKEAPL